ncbi:MAG: 50S ribosomal protein L6 [Candidatus Levybacteria bacterium RIFCSPHIGHO2_02_FULL_40_18]|nr:MAG: 50S ribosomal protein L6 [Candidatus Levybacteria bacterium RIFCSPHIGHO2_01_FULL_40_58]OGH26398.1 MAG: 50S ribosomal protein L6 [Candidatus Levybacteria bacterium RIFCSPHIGHO2_02_FULL_40_18]OGH31846.1 MAG: 50S ribosomal protein L6 [Candidatus Levybacteria bacterium RIFCSPHIGHO2_12_FULL_40_31]OGH40479.1 MAG: 50S ribosomal protein L6 [Candidatus Levybacteria bacterium RIFCSPLOWO2_01_FULL_40_64]OGH49188.1 MAG: 50S ribosomal protein L6 [Candidatus Levybacteria bacterium RIFCSPLOWO2_02_FULL_
MSNIGKKPVKITEGVTVSTEDDKIVVSGPKGTLETKIPHGIQATIKDHEVVFKKEEESHELEKFWGLSRALLANMVHGVVSGFEKKLELSGVGYRASTEGEELTLNVGYVNPVRIKAPQGIKFSVDENIITVSGIDKQLVGDIANKIRSVRPPEPYKGKGIKYVGEYIRRKAGKAAKTVGAAK